MQQSLRTFYILVIFFMLSATIQSKPFDWYRGGHITYDVQKKHDAVVDKAIALFASDMQAVTGEKAKEGGNADVMVYQLNSITNKDLKVLQNLNVPIMEFIAKKDAFWLGVRNGKIYIVGANGCGTAYGVLELSRMAGVSPWIWWGDVKPMRRNRLTIDDQFEITRAPSIELRGINIEQSNFSTTGYRHLFELMLRLRVNVLSAGWDSGTSKLPANRTFKDMADSFGIRTVLPHNGNSLRLHDHKKNTNIDITLHDDGYGYLMPTNNELENSGGLVYHLCVAGQPHDNLWLPTTAPGLIVNELHTAYIHGANRLWLISINNPKVLAYNLSLVTDLAWNINSVSVTNVDQHLQTWLGEQFTPAVATRLIQPLEEFIRLTTIRRPSMMDFSQQTSPSTTNPTGDAGVKNTAFNAEEFGNELERYLNNYQDICNSIDKTAELVEESNKDAYFATIQYPVHAASLMAVKLLQAQESRLIGRPASFHHDSEALESAARSMKAYLALEKLNQYYSDSLADGKWKNIVDNTPRRLAFFGKPALTDTISEQEITQYGNNMRIDAPLEDDGCLVRQGYEYASGSKGATEVSLLGRSLRSVTLQKDDSVVYEFQTGTVGGVLRLAFVPLFSLDGTSSECSIRIDSLPPTTIIINDGSQSERWAKGVLRGQSLVELPIALPSGSHTLTIKALNDHVAIDQWMIDRDVNRHFYVFPKR